MPFPVLVTPPVAAPVSLAEAKAHLRVDFDDEDALISGLIDAATQHLDGWSGVLGRALMPQTWQMSLDRFPAGAIQLPVGPVTFVESVAYLDANGVSQLVSTGDYDVDLAPIEGWIIPRDVGWPQALDSANAVTVRWIAGTGAPAPIKQAILLLVGHWYQNREPTALGGRPNIPMTVDALVAPWRRASF
jgi:uncharacterized phiE125 gp8 family phage protein